MADVEKVIKTLFPRSRFVWTGTRPVLCRLSARQEEARHFTTLKRPAAGKLV
ncbi:MAG: hypothetical protein ACI4W2_02775 [Eubacterium sp.]